MYFFLLAGSLTIYILTTISIRKMSKRDTWTQTEELAYSDSFTQTEFMEICSPPVSEYSDPFDIDFDFLKSKIEY